MDKNIFNFFKIKYFFTFLFFLLFFYLIFVSLNFDVFSKNYNYSHYFIYKNSLDFFSIFMVFYNVFICYSCLYYTIQKKRNNKLFLYLFLLFLILILVSLLFITNSIFIFFFIYESIMLPSVLLCYISSPNLRSKMVSYYFLFWTQSGSFFIFFPILYLYSLGLNFENSYYIYQKVNYSWLLSFFCFIGFGIKIPIWPFHFWLTKTHVEVNTSFSIFLSGVLVKVALLGFYKFFFLFSYNFFIYFCLVFLGIIDITIKLQQQVDFKKIVAYCTIFEMNIILLSIFFYNYNTLVFYLLFCVLHTTLSNVFFLLADFVYKRYNTRNIYCVGSLINNNPILSLVIICSVLLFNGMPLTLKFSLELSIFLKIINTDFFLFFFFYFIQIIFSIFFTKLNYCLLFQNIKTKKTGDMSFYEFLIIIFNFMILILI